VKILSLILQDPARPVFSVEFFPPKDEAGTEQLLEAVDRLSAVEPDFVSVTYGANGSSRDRTIDVTKRLAARTGVTTMAHLTCVDQPVAQVTDVIDHYAENGLENIFAIRGDMPGGPTIPWQAHPDGLANATRLVELIHERGDFCIGVAAFPDPHPSRHDPGLDARILKDKWEAGAGFAITQLFFRPGAYAELVDRVRSIGCDIPVIPGIMPITTVSQVARFAEMSGAVIPAPLLARLDAVAGDPDAVRETGVDIATELALELVEAGAPGLHFFTQNRSRATEEIWARLLGSGAV